MKRYIAPIEDLNGLAGFGVFPTHPVPMRCYVAAGIVKALAFVHPSDFRSFVRLVIDNDGCEHHS